MELLKKTGRVAVWRVELGMWRVGFGVYKNFKYLPFPRHQFYRTQPKFHLIGMGRVD